MTADDILTAAEAAAPAMGPWTDEDCGKLYVSRAMGWNAAQSAASRMAAELGDEWSHARYAGSRVVEIHLDCDWPACGGEEGHARLIDCFTFEVYEGRYREIR